MRFSFLFLFKVKTAFQTSNFVSAELWANCFPYLAQRGNGAWVHPSEEAGGLVTTDSGWLRALGVWDDCECWFLLFWAVHLSTLETIFHVQINMFSPTYILWFWATCSCFYGSKYHNGIMTAEFSLSQNFRDKAEYMFILKRHTLSPSWIPPKLAEHKSPTFLSLCFARQMVNVPGPPSLGSLAKSACKWGAQQLSKGSRKREDWLFWILFWLVWHGTGNSASLHVSRAWLGVRHTNCLLKGYDEIETS